MEARTSVYLRLIHCTAIAAICLAGCLCIRPGCAAPSISNIRVLSGSSLAQYARWEAAFDISGSYTNPYDPSQIDVEAQVQAPSGRTFQVPGFWDQNYIEQPITSKPQQNVQFFKFYIQNAQWPVGSNVTIDVAQPTLIDKQGVGHPIGGASPAWQAVGGSTMTWPSGLSFEGGPAAEYAATTGAVETWPGAVLAPPSPDLTRYKGFSMWVYPHNLDAGASLFLYFYDTYYGNSAEVTWPFDGQTLITNQWNKLTWYWPAARKPVVLVQQGKPEWRVRFTPVEAGDYSIKLTASVNGGAGGTATSNPRALTVTSSTANPGFVRISKGDPRYFAFDNGTPFFPVGHDVAWGLTDVSALYPKMHEHGENATYFILAPWDESFEWSHLGSYDQNRAAQLDHVIQCAEQNGIYLKLSFDIHDAMQPDGSWPSNPYNAANGGPCAGPNDFYTNATAQRYYQNRLRYICARWGYSTHLMGWEPTAEIDGATQLNGYDGWGYPTESGGAAITAMLATFLTSTGQYLKSIDPYGHLFTNSFGSNVSDETIWRLPIIDYTQVHSYEVDDPGQLLADWAQEQTANFNKPMMVTEFGWSIYGPNSATDLPGVTLHNGVWASAVSGAAGGALNWWWDVIDARNYYKQYPPLTNLAAKIDWPHEGFYSAATTVSTPAKPIVKGFNTTVEGRGGFGDITTDTFSIGSNGLLAGTTLPPQYLLARGRSEPHIIPKFNLKYATAGQFVVTVNTVAITSQMTISIDGTAVETVALPVQNVPNAYTIWDPQWSIWKCIYNQSFSVDVPAGKHQISVENSDPGYSWIELNSYQFQTGSAATIKPFGEIGGSDTLLWFWDTSSVWNQPTPHKVTGAQAAIYSLPAGTYTLTWLDPWSKNILGSSSLVATGDPTIIKLPGFTRDVAARLQKMN